MALSLVRPRADSSRSTGPSHPDALVDLVAGRLSFVFDSSLGQVQGAAVRALGVTAPERLRTLPDLPTMGEAGREGFVSQTWNSIAAPAGTPDDIVAALNGAVVPLIPSPEVHPSAGVTAR
jgi:tripartite-type tricarboxylate transporter receptor subunit TctC